jgi:hypothetical protein
VSSNWMTENNTLERIWKEAIIVSFKVLFQRLPGGTGNQQSKYSVFRAKFKIGISHVPLVRTFSVSPVCILLFQIPSDRKRTLGPFVSK